MSKKPMPIGVENFKEIIEGDCYYVDKTLAIRDIIDSRAKVTLFTRPRRFGKTLFQSMLQTFFEDERSVFKADFGKKIETKSYFDGLNITKTGDKYMEKQGKYPVISLSLKSAKQPDFQMAYESITMEIANEFIRNEYILKLNTLDNRYIEQFNKIMDRMASKADYANSLRFLSDCLYKATGQKTIILIDEYDVPLENAFAEGFYGEMIAFIRSLFESALKTNNSLEFAILTGCLRISKESIFTGLNNLNLVSVLSYEYDEYFGFTQQEVTELLEKQGLDNRIEEAKKWYDGYLFGNADVYNPWSMVNYVKNCMTSDQFPAKPYWANSSSNSIIHEIIRTTDKGLKNDIEGLLAGKTVEAYVHEEITYADIHNNTESLWNFLLFTGYLKKVTAVWEGDGTKMTMCIPNTEVKTIYKNSIMHWFGEKVKTLDLSDFVIAMENADTETMGKIIQRELLETISYLDSKESFYHGFLAGLLSAQKKYRVVSNREAGEGRYDILLKDYMEYEKAYLFELKAVDSFAKMEKAAREAILQIDEKRYEEDLELDGYEITNSFAVVFARKRCLFRAKNYNCDKKG